MKIGIVTIYKCYNFGSFYQAFGLQKYLEDLGHEVKFINIDSDYNKKYRLKKQFSKNIKKDFFSLRLIINYIRDWSLYKISKANDMEYDAIIIGSDEIWNINNRTFLPAPEYYGMGLENENVFTYASCVGKSTKDDFEKHRDLIDGIKKIKEISARDDNTIKFLNSVFINKTFQKVLDPSFLVNWHEMEKEVSLKDFILVYTYEGNWGLSKEYIDKIKEFAIDVKLPLISVGFNNDWCDKSIPCSPRKFLGYLKNATYVITDTFHGTVMSIQYQKQFLCMGEGKSKIESVLKDLNLLDRMYDNKRDINTYFTKAIEYNKTNNIIQYNKKCSKEYLQKNL